MTPVRNGSSELREQALGALNALNDAAKADSALLNGCLDAEWVDDDDRLSVRWLLSALKDHRRRIRCVARLWRSTSFGEPVDGSLAAATAELLDERRYFRAYVEKWRSAAVLGIRLERERFWRDMIDLAEANLRDAG